MLLRGISLSGKKPKKIKVKDNSRQKTQKEKKAAYNKKYYNRKTKRLIKNDNIKLDGKSKLRQRKKVTYIDECLKYNEKYQNMNVLQQEEFYRSLQQRLYSRKKDDLPTPLNDPYRKLWLNYNVLIHACKIMTRNQIVCAELLAAFVDREDGILRTSKNGYITIKEIAQITGYSITSAQALIYELDKLQVIHIEGVSQKEFEDIFRQEVEDTSIANQSAVNFAKREYRIYFNPFFIFVHQYIDKEIAVKYFYGSDWGLYNNHYLNIKKWIEKNCE